MGPDLSRFKVIYGDRVLHAITLENIEWKENEWPGARTGKETNTTTKPRFLTVLCINEDGNLVAIHDEAWRFQFVPIIQREG